MAGLERVGFAVRLAPAVLGLALQACAGMPLQKGNSLLSYEGMETSNGTLTKAKLRLESALILDARTVRLIPTSMSLSDGNAVTIEDGALITNAIDRALCVGLSDRFEIVGPGRPADLVVHASITGVAATGRTAAAASTVATLGAAVALPVPVPRLPIGLGGLSVEAEAIGRGGRQMAAMLWSRRADVITTRARVSTVGDAYSLSSAFAGDFSRMLVTGRDPFKGLPSIPSMQRITASLGGTPKYEACKTFGRAPGIPGAVARQLGLPPSWTDGGGDSSPQ
ncbi:DUF3313 domain-containing protein [Pleomorphomonas sp. NRK KF1]|uniref:DUF3313 domain-containing protein n=1 Tax=Pleomorphomonas sp. NRK KF1 TaxID=2943000 RepID=UPI002043E159|nr:DUF3313 domain-containing protein [Pleomorphomonas sp. NRK KF1]MCM5553354.1 DUF3313 domain-containing protein [Pleomorphomonas sp. NRK KF1]